MRSIYILFIIIFFSCSKENNISEAKKDITIFNKDGIAIAYCNYSHDNESIIYLWNGKPTSYLVNNENELYGFNGKFLGWKELGVYYDLTGKRIGFEKNALNIPTSPEPIKSIKEISPIRPVNSLEWSTVPLDEFLLEGIN